MKKLKSYLPADLSFVSLLSEAPDAGHRPDFLESFYPVDILPVNVSSVSGLAACLSKLLDMVKNTRFGPKLVLNVCFLFVFIHFLR